MSYNYRKEYAKWKRWKRTRTRNNLKQMNMPKNKNQRIKRVLIGHSSMTKDVLLGNKTLQTTNILR